MPPELKARYKHLKPGFLSLLIYFTGIFLLLGIFALVSYSLDAPNLSQEELTKRINTIAKGRIIEFEKEEGTYSTLKICKVEGEQVFALPNKFEIDSRKQLEQIQFPQNYAQDTLLYTKAELLEWIEEGKILEIYWGSRQDME